MYGSFQETEPQVFLTDHCVPLTGTTKCLVLYDPSYLAWQPAAWGHGEKGALGTKRAAIRAGMLVGGEGKREVEQVVAVILQQHL